MFIKNLAEFSLPVAIPLPFENYHIMGDTAPTPLDRPKQRTQSYFKFSGDRKEYSHGLDRMVVHQLYPEASNIKHT